MKSDPCWFFINRMKSDSLGYEAPQKPVLATIIDRVLGLSRCDPSGSEALRNLTLVRSDILWNLISRDMISLRILFNSVYDQM
jgi:hypothetical protein